MAKRPVMTAAPEADIDPAETIAHEFGAPDNSEGNSDAPEVTSDDDDGGEYEAPGTPPPAPPTPSPSAAAYPMQQPKLPPAAGDNKVGAVSTKAQMNALKRAIMVLGAKKGEGDVSMINLAETVTEAAQDGIITVSDTEELYDKFREGRAAKAVYEDSGEIPEDAAGIVPKAEKSRDQQLSKLRQFIHLGNKFDTDALDLIRRGRNMHLDLLRQAAGADDGKSGVKPGSTYTILVDVARQQLKKQKEHKAAKLNGLAAILSDAELRELMTQEVKETSPKTGEEKLLDAYVTAKAAYKGGKDRNPVPTTELENAIGWLHAALSKTAPDLLKQYEDDLSKAEADKAVAAAEKVKRDAEKQAAAEAKAAAAEAAKAAKAAA